MAKIDARTVEQLVRLVNEIPLNAKVFVSRRGLVIVRKNDDTETRIELKRWNVIDRGGSL